MRECTQTSQVRRSIGRENERGTFFNTSFLKRRSLMGAIVHLRWPDGDNIVRRCTVRLFDASSSVSARAVPGDRLTAFSSFDESFPIRARCLRCSESVFRSIDVESVL